MEKNVVPQRRGMALREVPQQCEEATGSNSDRKPGCPAGSRGGKHPVQKVLEATHLVPSHRRSPPTQELPG